MAATTSLLPTLPDLFNKRVRHLITDLQAGDNLHPTSKLLGFPKGYTLPIYGYCALYDADGQPYQVRAYVRPLSFEQKGVVASSEREAVRFRFDNQREVWFGERLMYLLEIDLTDHADCLRLERLPERVLALLPGTSTYYRQAA
ncbi:MAG: hypothetical protein ACRYFZ_00625 [Janthinobacterium lividum]